MPYVSIQLSAGLGNRLFQIAAMLGYAEKYGHTPILVKEWMTPDVHPTTEKVYEFFPDIPVIEKPTGEWLTLAMKPEYCFKYIELTNAGDKNIKLEGYFQSYSYFPKKPVLPTFLSNVPLQPKNTVFLHVRRADFLSPFNKHHNVDLTNYYEAALLRTKALYGNNFHIYVFSDDILWCKNNLTVKYNHLVSAEKWIWENVGNSEIAGLCGMSGCDAGGICANSTYSWWGAYFSYCKHNDNGIYYFPSTWGYPPLPPAYDVHPSWGTVL